MIEESRTLPQETHSAHERDGDATTLFGFWMYLMTDFVLFASLFAVFAVLRGSTIGGVSGKEIFNGPFILIETLILLTSSFTCGLTLISARANKKSLVLLFLAATFLLGVSFVGMEFYEFRHLAMAGNGWQTSGFLSSYFTLVGTHGLHVALGSLWMMALIAAIIQRGLTRPNMRKLVLLSIFWHFLDIVWIFIFTIVYLMSIV